MYNKDRTGTRLGALLLAALMLLVAMPAAAVREVMPGDVDHVPDEYIWEFDDDWFDFD